MGLVLLGQAKHAYRDGQLKEVVLRHLDFEDGNSNYFHGRHKMITDGSRLITVSFIHIGPPFSSLVSPPIMVVRGICNGPMKGQGSYASTLCMEHVSKGNTKRLSSFGSHCIYDHVKVSRTQVHGPLQISNGRPFCGKWVLNGYCKPSPNSISEFSVFTSGHAAQPIFSFTATGSCSHDERCPHIHGDQYQGLARQLSIKRLMTAPKPRPRR
ncbi:hypothetical protein M5K25_021269 [Dendrobium thyrsiflorum]|uniref:C3H1-type domain-containing protein n=1 Tax=Dendrobium thyrsiflorum TaxID=117978 RepID=A0ABD0UIZ9_DENTH